MNELQEIDRGNKGHIGVKWAVRVVWCAFFLGNFIKKSLGARCGAHMLILALGRQRYMELSKFKTSLVYEFQSSQDYSRDQMY